MELIEYKRKIFSISTDPDRLDFGVIHDYLQRSYWSPGIRKDVVQKAAQGSLCFGVYQEARQIGYARVISDYATFAYLADVFILEAFQRQGLGKWLMECIVAHPQLQNLRTWLLKTKDAHGLYEHFGFREINDAVSFMVRRLHEPS